MPSACVIGAGAVGSSLALRLEQVGTPVRCTMSRSRASAERLAQKLSNAFVLESAAEIPASTDLLLLCVPDDALEAVAERCASARDTWRGVLVMHVSGCHTTHALQAFEALGADVAGFHPIQSFPRHYNPGAFDGICIGVEATGDTLQRAEALASKLGAQAVRVSAAEKSAYHLAASVASNLVTVLLRLVEEAAERRAPESTWDLASFEPLIQTTIRNVLDAGAAGALTGPIARGDYGTVAAHLGAVQQVLPEWDAVYRTLGQQALKLARARQDTPGDRLDTIETMLNR